MVKPRFDLDTHLGAAVQEECGDLTFHQKNEISFADTGVVKKKQWSRSLLNEDWHARCQALCMGIEASDWKAMHCQFTGMGKKLDVQQPARSQRQRCSVDPANFRALIEQRDEIHQQRAQKALEAALKTVGDNEEHGLASSQADTNSTFCAFPARV